MREEEMVRWYHWFDGHEFEQSLGDDDELGSLAYCRPLDHRESISTEGLN